MPWAIPFEIPEVGFRIAFLLVALSLRHLLATRMGSLALAAICVVAGPLTTPDALPKPLPTLYSFLLPYLPHLLMRQCSLSGYAISVFENRPDRLLLVMSYALGSVLCLAAIALGHNAMVALGCGPIASGIAFIAATRNDAAAQGRIAFGARGSPIQRIKYRNAKIACLRKALPLALYAFVFAFFSARTASSEYAFSSGPVLQALCNIASAAIIISALLFSKKVRPLRGLPQHSIDFRPRIRSVRRCAKCGIIHRWRMHYARLFAFRSTLVKRLLQRS